MSETEYDVCYCTFEVNGEKLEITTGPTKMNHEGNGIFKCPACKTIHDKSKAYFKIRVKIWYPYPDCDNVRATIIEPYNKRLLENSSGDEKITISWKYTLQEEITECEHFEKHKLGVFDMEVIFFGYECGGYDCREYETLFDVIKEVEVKNGNW